LGLSYNGLHYVNIALEKVLRFPQSGIEQNFSRLYWRKGLYPPTIIKRHNNETLFLRSIATFALESSGGRRQSKMDEELVVEYSTNQKTKPDANIIESWHFYINKEIISIIQRE
jgi:hypothetical protein